jgi:hypothetical protein
VATRGAAARSMFSPRPIFLYVREGRFFSMSADRALLEVPREAEPRHFSGVPIQNRPARDPPLEPAPPHAAIEPRHVRRIYKKEEVKERLMRDLKGFG